MNTALVPSQTVAATGCEVMVAVLLTCKVAGVEVIPAGVHAFVITTWYWLLFIPAVMPGNERVAVVAPAILEKVAPPSVLTCHW